ncbi:MAG: peptide deformylase [Clostridiales bacterium]|nr:MAG: peptide deformylase [Clostridiales bacterium]
MAQLNIRTEHDPALRKKSRPVTEITQRIRTLLDDMLETMRAADGVGLAAPQVGVLRRIVVIEVTPGEVLELINPKILAQSGEMTGLEGCLSVPGKQGVVKRPSFVRVEALDRNGVMQTYEGTELLARCLCHEIDHLDGILYTDKAEKIIYPDEDGEYSEDDET